MNNKIDDGRIFRVCESQITDGMTYLDLRESNQQLVLQVMRESLEVVSTLNTVDEINSELLGWAEGVDLSRGSTYYSYKDIKRILSQIFEQNPEHPVFVGNEVFKKTLQKS